jgi:hypothetical protein
MSRLCTHSKNILLDLSKYREDSGNDRLELEDDDDVAVR